MADLMCEVALSWVYKLQNRLRINSNVVVVVLVAKQNNKNKQTESTLFDIVYLRGVYFDKANKRTF